MTYAIVYSDTALKQLKKLDRTVQIRVIAALERLRIRPYHFVKKLVGCPYFRLRVGDYRVILNVFEDKLMIFVIEVGHRRGS